MDFRPAVEILGVAAMFFLAVFGERWLASGRWLNSLAAYRLRFPGDLTADSVTRCLSVVAGATRRNPVVIEVVATKRGIEHHILIRRTLAPAMVTRLTTALPGLRVQEARGYLARRPRIRAACELRTSHAFRPLAGDRAEASIGSLLSALYPLGTGECVRLQWTLCGTHHRRIGGQVPAEAARALRDKQSLPLADVVGRIAVTASHHSRSRMLLASVLNGLAVVSAPGVYLTTRLLPSVVVARRVYLRELPLTAWPATLNAAELAAVAGIPLGEVRVPGLATGAARQLPVPPVMPRRGLVLARSNYPGMAERVIAMRTDDRLRHTLIQGPTGTGKSTLVANMALQDIWAGRGVIVIDPKSDLVNEILARIPAGREGDVIVIDPSATDQPIGFNILTAGTGEQETELVVDRVTHVFSELWRSSWGPRTSDVIRACLLTLTNTRAADGSAFALTELPELLTNEAFRRTVTAKPGVPESVRPFWHSFEQMSESERAQVIGPTMNKIRAITTRTALRLMLGQSTGISLRSLFREKKVILVPLSKGLIGTDAAQLLGSLLVALLWQETLARAAIPANKRHPVFAYLDEFQEVIRFGSGDELADTLAQSRSFGLGLTLAYQYLDQIPAHVLSAVLGTVRTQIVFQMEYGDAKKMAPRFTPLNLEDLSNLDAFEAAIRACVDGQTITPVTGATGPLPERLRDPQVLAEVSQGRYGTPRADVEAARKARINGHGIAGSSFTERGA